MKGKLRIVGALSLAILSACSSVDRVPDVANINEDNPCYFKETKEEAPAWVCTRYMENLVSGVGSYPDSQASQNLAFQVAQQRARVELAKTLQVRLKSSLESYESKIGAGTNQRLDEHVEAVAKSRIAIPLHGSRVYSSVYAPDGTLFVLVGVDEQLAKKNIKLALKTSFNDRESEWVKGEAEKAYAELEKLVN